MPGQPHVKIRANGVFQTPTGPVEIFSYGFCLAGADFFTLAQHAIVAGLVKDFHTRATSRIANACILTEVAGSNVDAAGKQIGQTVRNAFNDGGGGGPILHPTQVSCRISLSSGLRGRSQRGGFYIPGISVPIVAATMLMAAGEAGAIADSMVQLGDDLKANLPGTAANPNPGKLIVASKVAGNVPVNVVRVGRAFDTIRSRRNALQEAYEVRALA